MTPVDDELRDLLRERAVPPAAPPGRTQSVLRAARSRHRRRVAAATAATGLAVLAAVAVPVGLAARDSDPAPPAALPGPPPGSTPAAVTAVVAAGREMRVALGRGACDPVATGAAELRNGSWRLAVWTVGAGARSEGRPCTDQYIGYTLKVPLSEPYAGQPVVDAASGRRVEVNGGPGFLVPTYLPPGYSMNPGDKGGLTLNGPHGTIVLLEGGREIGTVRDYPGWPYDVLDRPDISGHPGLLIRYRNDGDNTMLRWLAGDRGVSLQVFSATLDPQELVRIARGLR